MSAASRVSALLLAVLALGAGATDLGYQTEVGRWRAEREASLKADDGWLTLAGLFWLKEGTSSFGSAADNAIVLPDSAPPRSGAFEHRRGVTTARIESGVTATLAGRPFSQGELRAGGKAEPEVLQIGPLSMFVIERGDRYAIRVRDKLSPNRKTFGGLHWFPVDEGYRVEARFTPHPEERRIPIASVVGSVTQMRSPGRVSFVLAGRMLTLEPVYESDDAQELFYIFKDGTAGRETYGAGRFLYSELPKDGRLILDFNRAHSPPCAYTPYATCPLPPRQNVLPVRIEAGEKNLGH